MGAPGVKPARLMVRLGPGVASMIEVPLCRPATSECAFCRPPAHDAKSEAMLESETSIRVAAMADEAARSDAASDMASLRWSIRHLSENCLHYCASASGEAVGALRDC